MIELTRDGETFVLRMDHGENRFSPEMLDALLDAFDEVAAAEGPLAVVTTGSGKFFTNGLDLDWLSDHPDQLTWYLGRVQQLFARVLTMPCPTVAAANGHTYGAGAMLGLAHDHRFMRTDRGFWCLPEVNLGMPFPPAMQSLVTARLPTLVAHEAMVTGRRFGGEEAAARGIVEQAVADTDLLPVAVQTASALTTTAGANLAGIRSALHAGVLADLAAPIRPAPDT